MGLQNNTMHKTSLAKETSSKRVLKWDVHIMLNSSITTPSTRAHRLLKSNGALAAASALADLLVCGLMLSAPCIVDPPIDAAASPVRAAVKTDSGQLQAAAKY